MLRPFALCLVAVGLLASCSSGTVTIAFHPKPGAAYGYDVSVRTQATTRLGGQPVQHRGDELRIHATQRVLESGAAGVRVQVQLTAADGSRTTFIVGFDRAAQPTEVQQTEGLPSSVLGGLGLSEVFPAAAGAPPRRPLRPGARWPIDQRLTFGTGTPSRLQGSGRLVTLGIVNGRKVATVRTSYRLPLRSVTSEASGEVTLDGTESSEITTTRSLTDGAVEKASAHTTGEFRIEVRPPAQSAAAAAPVTGRLSIDVRSTTARVSASR